MPTNRSYPDISFVETDTETIANALIRGYGRPVVSVVLFYERVCLF